MNSSQAIGVAGSDSEPSGSTPSSGCSQAASALGSPGQPWLLEETPSRAQGISFQAQYFNMFSSRSCSNLHSAVYASGRTASHYRVDNPEQTTPAGSPERHPEKERLSNLKLLKASATTSEKICNSTTH